MAYKFEKETGDIVINGFENGIAPSPHKGIANIQGANISTEMGEVINSFARVQQSMTGTTTTGSLSYLSTDHVNLSITGSNNLFKGNWITVTNSSNTGQLPNGTYYVPPSTGAGFELAKYYNTQNFIPIISATLLAVGGGGAGGGGAAANSGGGGGAGGFKNPSVPITSATPYLITVGTGGTGTTAVGGSGNPSIFATGAAAIVTADGGGGGGATNGGAGAAGGSGGGGGNNTGAAGVGTVGEGHNGGTGSTNTGGGGGGATAAGANGTTSGGNGGNGTASSISGASVTYAGGGGGGGNGAGTGGSGGTGGGGAGASTTGNGTAATVNTGGGGGGAVASGSGGNGASGIVIISIPTSSGVTATGGTHTTSGGNDIWTFTTSGTWTPTIPVTTVAPILTGFTAGLTATIQLAAVMGKPLAKATEVYFNNGIVYHRYYILDNQNLVWVYDEINETLYSSTDGVTWFLPDIQTNWCTVASGLAVISGFLIGTASTGIYSKPVTMLGNTNSTATTWVQLTDRFTDTWKGAGLSTTIPHFAFTGAQGTVYITDASYIVSLEPNGAIASKGTGSTAQNIQSFSTWTVPTGVTNGSASVISGTTPVSDDSKRVPAVFFVPNTGSLPSTITAGTVYYIDFSFNNLSDLIFEVYVAPTGGSALDISTGSEGVQYFNTFYPYGSFVTSSAGTTPTYVFESPSVALPIYEVAQCLAEISTIILIGCKSSIVYPWDQAQTQAFTIIPLPESNVTNIVSVNQMGYIFAGNKGNIYITDGSVASLVSTVPDYCAGVPGTPSTYIEPVYTWGGADYVRGRVYFSLLDQTTTKAGNCGGIWSFVPTQNFYIGQDVGIALHMENQSSYGTYNGYSPIIIAKAGQAVSSPQYWNAWQSTVTSPVYGIDFTGTGSLSAQPFVVESDLVPTGTMLEKKTFEQIQFKLTTPLLIGDSLVLNYRKDATSAWKSCGTVKLQNDKLSGYVSANFEKTQWLQLQGIGTAGTTSSFVRLVEFRIH